MNKNTWYWVIGIVVVLLIIWGVYAANHNSSQPAAPSSPTSSQSTDQTMNASSTAAAPSPSPAAPAKLTYGAAINAYKFRFQFSQCHGNPGTIDMKKGSPLMLDNRDNAAHTIKADNQSFRVGPLDYVVFNTSAVGTFTVTCDGGGAAKLTVEK